MSEKTTYVASFRIDHETMKELQDIMIDRRQFNKSEVQREIFMIGLEVYRAKHKKNYRK